MRSTITGNTPTSVGKTTRSTSSLAASRKHPHKRGEDPGFERWSIDDKETPPQAWGRRRRSAEKEAPVGNTPTSVGKTIGSGNGFATYKKHPHKRGEDFIMTILKGTRMETPPQAWGRQQQREIYLWVGRNTPTSVGKTRPPAAHAPWPRKHPHKRGEDGRTGASSSASSETPPQAWGRLFQVISPSQCTRNTPTSVGKTYKTLHLRLKC